MRLLPVIFAPAALLLLGAQCPFQNAQGPRGEEHLGDFTFLGTSAQDTCLSTRYSASLTFPASLSRTREIFFFGGPGGTIKGLISGKTFTVTFGGTEQLDRLCSVQREETLSGTLEATSLAGSYVVRVIPIAGTSCLGAVLGAGRQFATLPCEVRYNVVGTRTDTPDAGAADAGADAADAGAPDGGV